MGDDARDDHVHAFVFVASPQRLPDHISEASNQPLQELRGPLAAKPLSPFRSVPEVYG
jgi:hypothetical protein